MGSGSPPRIVFLDRETLSPQTRLRAPSFPHRLDVFEKTAPAEVVERIADAEIVITNKVPLRRESIVSAKNLRLVAVAATGTDIVDAKACAERGITVSNIRNYAVNTVPEHTFALIFALRRSITAYRDAVIKGRWQEAGQFCFFDYPIHDIAGSTLGIVGDGVLGQAVAALPDTVIGGLIVAVERLIRYDDARQPFHGSHPVPAADDSADGKAVGRAQHFAVHAIGQDYFGL